uniref:Uncharacterized protein n=1 Tax=Candidatus Kentrum sp. UNK TaxID=2126344 RepID=A0A451A3R0_9GAMM|nr:MAG: hypothetical protein BECKUNK1418G_GA0071005_101236 [Candidatus Kentron sp. UNK]VFK69838.1 MAG: hypothetical protein BECKUNK1418H_GA0071006_10206 [Candidatus Kentron sp. UNK]
MYSVKDCPVCKRPDLTEAMEYCPQCGADLECFQLLDNLQTPGNIGHAQKGGSTLSPGSKWFLLLSLFVLLSVLIAAGGYFHRRMDMLAARLNEIEAVLRSGQLAQHPTALGQRMETREEEDFQNRIDDLDERRAAAWRRIKAALAAYGPPTSDDLRSRP